MLKIIAFTSVLICTQAYSSVSKSVTTELRNPNVRVLETESEANSNALVVTRIMISGLGQKFQKGFFQYKENDYVTRNVKKKLSSQNSKFINIYESNGRVLHKAGEGDFVIRGQDVYVRFNHRLPVFPQTGEAKVGSFHKTGNRIRLSSSGKLTCSYTHYIEMAFPLFIYVDKRDSITCTFQP